MLGRQRGGVRAATVTRLAALHPAPTGDRVVGSEVPARPGAVECTDVVLADELWRW